MDWDYEIEQHRAMIQRIVGLLFALADLADRATGRSFRVRCEVLFILSHGEAVARAFILEEAQWFGMPILYLPSPAYDGFSAGDATQLAARFRALAAILAYIWALTLPSMRRPPRHYTLSHSPARTARHILRLRRCVCFRALDSPFRCCG